MILTQVDTAALRPVTDLLLQMAQAPEPATLFPTVTRGIAASSDEIAAIGIWVIGHGPACATSGEGCANKEDCFHLASSASRTTEGLVADSDAHLEGALRQTPLAALDLDALDPVWRREQRIEHAAGARIVHRARVLGVVSAFSRTSPGPMSADVLQLFANLLAVAIANDEARREIERLQERIEGERTRSRPPANGTVVSEADVRKFERENIAAALEATGGRVYGRGGAAELLGLKPTTLASRLKKLGLSPRA